METETMMAGSRRLQGGRNQFLGQKKGQFEGSFIYFYLLLFNFLFTFKGLDTGKVS